MTGGFTDWHAHTTLQTPHPSPVTRVIDLGSNPATLDARRTRLLRQGVTLEHAGPFLTAPGGYPSDRDWAEAGMVRFVTSAVEAHQAVTEILGSGARFVKVVLHPAAGPTLSTELLRIIVNASHPVPVVAHAEGEGEASRAREAGATHLAHTPFSEHLSDSEIAAQARSMTWITTLDIHGWGQPNEEYHTAVENLQRFAEAGGKVRYGTDMGNGPTSGGLNHRELAAMSEAGLSGKQILHALTPAPLTRASPRVWIPGTPQKPRPHEAVLKP